MRLARFSRNLPSVRNTCSMALPKPISDAMIHLTLTSCIRSNGSGSSQVAVSEESSIHCLCGYLIAIFLHTKSETVDTTSAYLEFLQIVAC